jgi:hypothetical protein
MLVASLTSCQHSPREMLIGVYEVTEVTTTQKMSDEDRMIWKEVMEDLKKSTKLVLSSDGTMLQTYNGVTKKGTWEVYGDDGEEGEGWRLKLIMEDKSTVNMVINDLTSSGFVNVMHDEASKSNTTITYAKVN